MDDMNFQNMFFEYPWNNFLHMQVELCISTSLVSCTNVAVEVNCESGEAERSITLRHHVSSFYLALSFWLYSIFLSIVAIRMPSCTEIVGWCQK